MSDDQSTPSVALSRAVFDHHGVTTRDPARVLLARQGAFGLSEVALARLRQLLGDTVDLDVVDRDDPRLLQAVVEVSLPVAAAPGTLLTIVVVPARSGWRLSRTGEGETLVRFPPPRRRRTTAKSPTKSPIKAPVKE